MVCSASTRPSSAVSSTSSRRSTSTGVDRPWLTSSKCRGSRWNAGRLGKSMGKSMENPWETMEIYQKSMGNYGNLSKIHGKTMEIYEKSREISETSMGKRGKPMESHLEFRKIRLKIRGTFGNSMVAWKRFNIWTGKLNLWKMDSMCTFHLHNLGKPMRILQNRNNNCHPDTMAKKLGCSIIFLSLHALWIDVTTWDESAAYPTWSGNDQDVTKIAGSHAGSWL